MPQLPGYNVGNALDWSPLQNALAGARQANFQNLESKRQDEQLAMQKQSNALQQQNIKRQWQQQDVERLGKAAFAIDQMPDGPQRQAAWTRWVQAHGADGLSPEEMDHRVGPRLAAAQAGLYNDPMQKQMQQTDMALKQAQIGALNRKAEPDPIDQFILGRLRGAGAAPAAPAPGQPAPPAIIPQSFDGQGPMPGGVQLIADQQPAQGGAPQGDMVETPYGRMPRDEAQSLAGSMLLSPKYSAAGRAILDSISKGSDVGMSKPAANQLDERTISAASTLGRLQEIKRQFKPEFQQIPTKMKMLGASWGAAFGGNLNPEMQKQLQDYASYRATAFDNFNQLLKELSGTAVSAQELARQKIVQPNPGEGLLDGDDPVTLQSKMNQGERIAKAAIARMNYMRNQGLQFNKDTAEQFMRLEDLPQVIEHRGAQIEQELRQQNPKADPQALEQETKRRLKQEFGI